MRVPEGGEIPLDRDTTRHTHRFRFQVRARLSEAAVALLSPVQIQVWLQLLTCGEHVS